MLMYVPTINYNLAMPCFKYFRLSKMFGSIVIFKNVCTNVLDKILLELLAAQTDFYFLFSLDSSSLRF